MGFCWEGNESSDFMKGVRETDEETWMRIFIFWTRNSETSVPKTTLLRQAAVEKQPLQNVHSSYSPWQQSIYNNTNATSPLIIVFCLYILFSNTHLIAYTNLTSRLAVIFSERTLPIIDIEFAERIIMDKTHTHTSLASYYVELVSCLDINFTR